MYEARIIADSINRGHRLTTMVATYPRMVHSELMTHCMFARNAASSRAIPVAKQLKMVEEDPFIPEYFGKEQKGMQHSEELDPKQYEEALIEWNRARGYAIRRAKRMLALGMHKNMPNRLLEPFSWITTIITGTDEGWANFFAQRCEGAAERHLQKIAFMLQYEYFTAIPADVPANGWHLPFVTLEERLTIPLGTLIKASVARVARVSYRQHDGTVDLDKDLQRYHLLRHSNPKHMSPFAHVARPSNDDEYHANLRGWIPFRKIVKDEFVTTFTPNHPLLLQFPERIAGQFVRTSATCGN